MSQKSDLNQMELLVSESSPGGSPAKTSQLQGNRSVLRAKGRVYGASCAELLAIYDPVTQSWRTSQRCLVETAGDGFSEFLETWPRSGMTVNGIAYRLPNLARTITEIGSGLFATPNTLDGMPPKSEKALKREMEVTRKGRSQPANLRDQVTQRFWRTPEASNGGTRGLYATKESIDRRLAKGGQLDLPNQVKHKHLWPTPCSRDYKGARSSESLEKAGRDGTNSLPDSFAVSGKSARLNPQFVEVLMGYPIMHTALKDLETP